MSYVYITEENAKLQKKGGKYQVGRNLEVVMSIPEETLEALTLIGNIQVSADAMTSLIKSGIPVTWLSHRGRFFGRLCSIEHVDVFRQKKQIEMLNSRFSLCMTRRILEAKIHNQAILLRRYNRRSDVSGIINKIRQINLMEDRVIRAVDREKAMGFEGIAARYYFEALGMLVPEEFRFQKRTRRPPKDPFNAMLSFAYTLLMYELFVCVENHGLSPYFGFMHALKNNHPSLVSDLMEEWRAVIVDSMVMSLINHHEITAEHFTTNEENEGVYLSRDGRNIFIKAYEKKMRTVNRYLGDSKSYRESLNYQVHAYSQALMADNADMYEPIMLR